MAIAFEARASAPVLPQVGDAGGLHVQGRRAAKPIANDHLFWNGDILIRPVRLHLQLGGLNYPPGDEAHMPDGQARGDGMCRAISIVECRLAIAVIVDLP